MLLSLLVVAVLASNPGFQSTPVSSRPNLAEDNKPEPAEGSVVENRGLSASLGLPDDSFMTYLLWVY